MKLKKIITAISIITTFCLIQACSASTTTDNVSKNTLESNSYLLTEGIIDTFDKTNIDLSEAIMISSNLLYYASKCNEAEQKYRKLESSRKKIGNEEFYNRFLDLVEEYKDFVDQPETIYDVYTEEEIHYLFRMVQSETNGCSFDARVNVANVAFNRVESSRFPNNLKNVITSPGQFYYSKTKIDEKTIKACEFAFMFEDTTNGALFFHSHCSHTSGFFDDSGHHFI